MAERKTNNNRGYIFFVFVVILGYALGLVLKKVTLGLVIGLVLGILSSGFLRRR